jgi:hypothetical protein
MRMGGRTDSQRGRRTDMTKLMAAFRNFPKAPKKSKIKISYKKCRKFYSQDEDTEVNFTQGILRTFSIF